VDRVNDLCVVDSQQIGRGDPQVGMSELSLDDEQRHAFSGHLDRVSVSELVRSETAAHPGEGRGVVQLHTHARWRARRKTISCCLSRRFSAITARTPPGP